MNLRLQTDPLEHCLLGYMWHHLSRWAAGGGADQGRWERLEARDPCGHVHLRCRRVGVK